MRLLCGNRVDMCQSMVTLASNLGVKLICIKDIPYAFVLMNT